MIQDTARTTVIAYAAATLHAPVEILDEQPLDDGRVRVRTLPGGVGGWATPGKVLIVDRALLTGIDGDNGPGELGITEPAPLAEPISAEDYMQVLVQRQQAWIANHGAGRSLWASKPLLEWFVAPGDEQFVRLPEPATTREPQPRTYRSAASLRSERDEVARTMHQVAHNGDETDDVAAVNLSPHSRSRAARNAGRRRFARLDRDLERYATLKRRLEQLDGRIAAAEARERRCDKGFRKHEVRTERVNHNVPTRMAPP